MTLVIDQVLQNRYRIVSRLGQGGMGAVYRAWDTRLEVLLAVKEMTPQPGLDSRTLTQLRQQFQQEATVLARLDHPYLVRVTDFFSEAANAYLVMNFVEGESLADWIAQHGRLPEQDVLAWADQLLDALAYCHDQGVIHRDVKPQNVIIRPDGRAVLVDFGLVKLWDPNDPRTRTAMRGMGTPEYAPPEQYDVAAGHTDARSDVYSLGATLYHALSGQVPPTATMRIVNPESLASVRTLVPGVSTETERAVTRAMELQPTARFQSAAEMRATLSDLALSWPQTRVMTEAQPATPAPLRRIPMWVWGLGAVAAVAVITVLLSSAMGANALSSHAPAAEPLPTAVATTRSPPNIYISADGHLNPPADRHTDSCTAPTSGSHRAPERCTGRTTGLHQKGSTPGGLAA
jgi:serine/threonine protein kinase